MDTCGLLVRLEAKAGKHDEVARILRSARPMFDAELDTTAWFGVRFGRRAFGIFDVFPTDAGRQAHLDGAVVATLKSRAAELLARPPVVTKLDVLGEKLPAMPSVLDDKGLLLTFRARAGKEIAVEDFLHQAQPLVDEEPDTTAWFAIRLADGEYGIFDTFRDRHGRFAHLTGRVPRELARRAFSILGNVPDLELLDVVSEKLPMA